MQPLKFHLAQKEEAARSYQRLQTISSSTFTTNVDQP
jgi:hypothetical protein